MRGPGIIICLPGVPRELEYLMKRRVIPYLQERLGEAATIKARVLRTCAIGESQIDALIGDLMTEGNPTVGLAAHSGQVDVRITAKAASETEANRLIAPVEAEVRMRLGDAIYGQGTETLEEVAARLLAERGMTLALVDSVTGGEVADRLYNTSHAQVLIAEDRSPDPPPAAVAAGLDRPPEVTEHIATRVREDAGASLGLAILGVVPQQSAQRAGGGERPLAYVSVSDGSQVVTRSFYYGSQSKLTRRWLSISALDLVRRYLIGALD